MTASSFIHTAGVQAGYVAKTGTYTTTTSDFVIEASSGTFQINLISAVGITGQVFIIKNSNSGTITIDGNGAETIDGAATYTLSAQYKYVQIMSNGSNWIVIGNN
jgi:phage gp45-like